LPTYTGVVTASNVAVNGNVTAQYVLGSGQFLTGLPAGYSNVNVAAYTQTQSYTNYSNVNVAAYTQTQSYTNYSNVNLSAYLGGAVTIGGNLTVNGNLFINGNLTTINANNLSINDSMIYLADDNPADTLDIGFVSAFTDAVRYQHTGFVRDATDGVWKLFANVVSEPTTTVDFTNATYSNLQVGNLITVGSGQFSGMFNENATSSGVFIGNASPSAPTPRVGFFNGNSTQNWQIDNNFGTFRWFTPGVVRMSLDARGNLSVFNFANINITSGSADSALQIVGNVSRGGASYHDFLRVTSTASGATNPNKHFRLSGAGNLEIVNSAYSSVLLSLTDAGQLILGSSAASTSTTTGALVVTGGVGVGGNLFVGGALTESSSATLKENITPIDGALDLILQLTGVIYDRRDGSRKNEAGLIAEEVNKVLPNLITLDDQGTPLGVQYTKLTAYLIEAVKSLKAEIDQLKKRD
jgi:cytidine deaminase